MSALQVRLLIVYKEKFIEELEDGALYKVNKESLDTLIPDVSY